MALLLQLSILRNARSQITKCIIELLGLEQLEYALIQSWQNILETCRLWMVNNLGIAEQDYHWDQEWLRWKQYAWEVFWGTAETPDMAMRDLEHRKLKRDWIGINWIGESSSLTDTDAIAWGRNIKNQGDL